MPIVAAIVVIVTLDVTSAYLLFFYQRVFEVRNIWAPEHSRLVAYGDGWTPGLAVVDTVFQRLRPETPLQREVARSEMWDDPSVMQKRHEVLGWAAVPGSYTFGFCPPAERRVGMPACHDWHVTALADGERATTRVPVQRGRKMFVFGDSWIFGWALDDELTMAWMLQSEYRDLFSVRLLAHPGHGHLQALMNFERIRHEVRQADILIFGYAQWLLPRNLPSPSVVASLSQSHARFADGQGRPLMYPRAIVSGGKVGVELMPLDCAMVHGYCSEPEPTLETLFDVTNQIFDQIIDGTDATILVLLMDGPEDKVVEHLRARGVPVIDGRPPHDVYAKDTMEPYDAHPGPIAHHYWFTQLRSAIDQRR